MNLNSLESYLMVVTYKKTVISYNFNFYVVHALFHKLQFCKQRQAEIGKKIKQMLSKTLRLKFCYYSHSSFTLSSKNNWTYSKKKKKKMCVCIHEIRWLIIRTNLLMEKTDANNYSDIYLRIIYHNCKIKLTLKYFSHI